LKASLSDDTSKTESDHPVNTDRKEKVVVDFVTQVELAIQSQLFVSLTLRGVKKAKAKVSSESLDLRGSIRQVQGRLVKIKNSQDPQLQLTLKYHGATDICKNIMLEEISEKLPSLILDPVVSEWGIEAIQARPIQGAKLETTSTVWDLQLQKKPKLKSQQLKSSSTSTKPSLMPHDREKNTPLSRKADFLQYLGLTTADGKPKPGMKSKLRQCQKFVEIVGGLVDKANANDQKPISIIDMGCGRGYLTFSLHSYLTENYSKVHSRGIDVRPKLVEEINTISSSLGGSFDTLTFEEGTIEEFVSSVSSENRSKQAEIGILIALHACDTATDDALWSGICSGADLMIVAPCCHKQIRSQLTVHCTALGQSHPMTDVLRYGIYQERISETVTGKFAVPINFLWEMRRGNSEICFLLVLDIDSLRALLLEAAGYKVQVFEFIGGEHTSKNVMITAVKNASGIDRNEVQKRIESLAAMYGIRQQKLARWMNLKLGQGEDDAALIKTKKQRLANQMPPLS
jgi:hypothetical protein